MKKEKLFKVMLSGILACSLAMTSVVPMTPVTAQETTEDATSDSSEIKRIVYDGTAQSEKAIREATGKICIVVQEEFTEIPENMIYDIFKDIDDVDKRDKIVEIELPEGLKKIGYYAFAYCDKLEKVNIPSTVTTIDDGAFSECHGIKNIELPDGLKEFNSDDGIFDSDTSITWKGKTYRAGVFAKHFRRATSSVTKLNKVSGVKVELLYADMKSVKVSWNKVKNAKKYQLAYADNKNFKKATLIKTTKTSKELRKLKKGKKYYFRVRAVNDYDSEYVEILYSTYSAAKNIKLTLKACNKKIKENYLKILKKRKLYNLKANYFKIIDFDGDGLLDMFFAKGKKDFALCGYTTKYEAENSNFPKLTEKPAIAVNQDNDKYNKASVNLKKKTITTGRIITAKEAKKTDMIQGEYYEMRYFKGDKLWTGSFGTGRNIYCAHQFYENKHTYSYNPKGTEDGKNVNKKTYEKVLKKIKKSLKWHSFMVKNTAKNRAKYCK